MVGVSSVRAWSAIAELAALWNGTPVVQQVAQELPRVTPPKQGIPRYLQALAAGAPSILAQPLAVSGRVRMAQQFPMLPTEQPDPIALKAWLEAGDWLQIAHLETVEWLRSRLPGYPTVGAPQLARGTSFTSEEWGYRIPWRYKAFAEGHQQRTTPRPIGRLLGDPSSEETIGQATVNLAGAFASTDEWRQYRESRSALSGEDKLALKEARGRLTAECAAEAIDAYEPGLVVPREQYRRSVTSTTVESLTGPAREFAEAFAAVDSMINDASVEVFAQLAVYGQPRTIEASELDIKGGDQQQLFFEVDDADFPWPDPGNLLWLDEPLITDAIIVTSKSFSMTGSAAKLRIGARVIAGSSGAFH